MITRVLPALGVAVAASLVGVGCASSPVRKVAASIPTTLPAVDPNAPETNDPGDIPDNQIFVAYSPPGAGYSVKVPEGWGRSIEGSAVVFTDKFNSVRMEAVAVATAPTVDSATTVEVPIIQKAAKAFALGKVRSVTRKGGPGVLVTYEANSAPNAVTGKSIRLAVERYEFWKNGEEVILTLSGATGADNVDPWKAVTDGFSWTA